LIRNTLKPMSLQRHQTLRAVTIMASTATLAGVVAMTALATIATAPAAHAAPLASSASLSNHQEVKTTTGTRRTAPAVPHLSYHRGYSVQGSWYCYGWANGALHCTQRWHRSGNHIISDNSSWVPNFGIKVSPLLPDSISRVTDQKSAPSYQLSSSLEGSTSSGEPCRSSWYFSGHPSQWQIPPSCYAGVYRVNPADYVYRPGFGWCNWWPEVMNPTRPNLLYGPYRRGSVPIPGATVVFAPGVQGASAGGHYARVVAVYPGGQWVLISEMNFYWRGGGFGIVSYRYVYTGPGVTFIY